MIKINLLQGELAGGNKGQSFAAAPSENQGAAAVGVTLLAVVAILAGLGSFIYLQVTGAQRERAEAEAQLASINRELNELRVAYNEANADMDTTRRLIQIAEALDPPDRVLWARKLNMLPLLVPDGVFLTNIMVNRQVAEIETEASLQARNDWNRTRRGAPPEPEMVPSITQTMVLDGVSYVPNGTDTQRLDQIVVFARALERQRVRVPFDQADVSFMDGFIPVLETSAVDAQEIEGRQVSRFTLTLRTRPVVIN